MEDWPSIRLRSIKDFQWLIPDTADTTVTNTVCAYDRWGQEVAEGEMACTLSLPSPAQAAAAFSTCQPAMAGTD